MTKKHFIALADAIREHNAVAAKWQWPDDNRFPLFNKEHISTLADFCREQNSAFNRSRWLGYIAGENGKTGGAVK